MAEPPRAARLPDRSVRIAARLLPARLRDRYEREFLSELSGMTSWQQTRHALDILIHTPTLWAAIRAVPPPDAPVDRRMHPRGSLICRLHLNHRWIIQATTDGQRYLRCRRCGKDQTGRYGTRLPPEAVVGFYAN